MANVRKGMRISGADREQITAEIRRRYENGESIRSIAAAVQRSYGFVNRVLHESGVTLRSRGGATRRRAGAH
ncbi:MAG: hypothetical protein GEV07_27555 [Streptosporangiales bacterium]|nr:hypothetical protein [Streptosporangiales bacterium]